MPPRRMRFFGMEKVHRNSIKITVDLWQMTLILIKDAPLGENCTPYGSFAPPKLQVILS